MKDVAGMLAEKYGATADEIVAAGAMKLYLQSMEPAEALRKVRAVYEPKVIMLDSGEGVPVQSNIDGAKYAAFIDESVVFAAQKMRGRGDALAEMVMEKLKDLDAKYQEVVDGASQKTLLFGDRFPFRYLVDDYGLSYYAAFVG